MPPQKTYLVRRSDSGERVYQLYELTWLWRTGELAHDALFRDDDGQWRPVNELVEPVLQAQQAAESPRTNEPDRWRSPVLWWCLALGVALAAGAIVGPDVVLQYSAWKAAKLQEREAAERERAARIEDFVASNLAVLGMTREEVRRTIGPPRSIKATGDGGVERWVYRKQIVVIENGKVIGFEDMK
jgi:hypothetical protein